MNKITMRRGLFLLALLALLACAATGLASSAREQTIELSGETIAFEGEGVTIEGSTATILQAGTYTLTGVLDGGRIIVDAGSHVTLILNGVSITGSGGPAIDIQNADSVTLTLAAGTENSITDTAQYTDAPDGQDAAVFSKADLLINGEGSLYVNALYNDGIASRDTLTIESGSITVASINHGIKGKDYLLITGGELEVNAGGDAIKSTNDQQANLGYVQIDGGTLTLSAGDDGISAVTAIEIANASITIGSQNNGMKSDGAVRILSGRVTINYADDDFVCQSKELSEQAEIALNKTR